MIRRSWMLVGLLSFVAGVAHADWVYGLGADGGYAYGGKNHEVAQGTSADMQARAYGRLGVERAGGNVGLFVLGDVGKRPGNRFFGDLGVGFHLNRLELRAYDAWDFGDGANALHAGTGALSLALGRWNLGVYGYLPLGRAYAVRHINSVPALNEVAGSNQLQKGTEKTYSYDVALKGGEGRLWYTILLGSRGDFRFGVGGYYLVRDADVLEKAEPRVGPSVDAGWDFAKTSALRVGIYGHYAYDKVLGQQLGFRLSFRLRGGPAAGEFLGLHYGVVTASFSRTAFVGQNDFNGNNTTGGRSTGGRGTGGRGTGGGSTGGRGTGGGSTGGGGTGGGGTGGGGTGGGGTGGGGTGGGGTGGGGTGGGGTGGGGTGGGGTGGGGTGGGGTGGGGTGGGGTGGGGTGGGGTGGGGTGGGGTGGGGTGGGGTGGGGTGGGGTGGGGTGGGGTGGGGTGGGGHHDHGGGGHSGPVIVSNPKDFQNALNSGAKSIFVSGPITLTGFQKLPDGVRLCGGSGGKCGETVLYRFGVRDNGQNPGELRAPKNVLQLGANTTLENIDVISTARDEWYKALYVNSTVQDLGTITLKNVGVHGLLYFYQNGGRAKAIYDVENLKILRRDVDGKELPFPDKSIPDPDGLDSTTFYYNYDGFGGLNRISMQSAGGALLTIASTGDDSSLEVRKFSASLLRLPSTPENPDKGLAFDHPLFYIYAPGKGGKKEVGPVDLGGIWMQSHNLTGAPRHYHYDPLVMIRGGGGKKVHVKKLTMPAKGGTSDVSPFLKVNPDVLFPSRATLEVIEGQVDTLDWPYNHGLESGDVSLSMAGPTPWALLYAYDSEFGQISIRFGVLMSVYDFLPEDLPPVESGLLSFVSSRLKGDVRFLSDGYGAVECPRTVTGGCREVVFVGLTGTEAHPTQVDKYVTVSAAFSHLVVYDTFTTFLKGFGTVHGLRGSPKEGYTGRLVNIKSSERAPLEDRYTCMVNRGFWVGLPSCP